MSGSDPAGHAGIPELETLAELDEMLRTLPQQPASLSPNRVIATPLCQLAGQLVGDEYPIEVARAWAGGLAAIVRAEQAAFPQNIFWDHDYLAARLLAAGNAPAIDEMARRIVALQEGFGQSSVLRFQFIHDFSYGFDWARWVAKDPSSRHQTGPLDLAFLEYLENRGKELVALIDNDDAKYHRLTGNGPRNPFRFSRTPADERALLEALARDDLIPVKAWRLDAECQWDRPYTALREEYAARLEIQFWPKKPK